MKEHRKNNHRSKITRKKNKIVDDELSNLVCDECGEMFDKKSAYKYHLQSRHSREDLICEICSYKTGTIKAMNRHRETHSKPSLPCDECGKLFKGPFYLYQHKRNLHSDSKDRLFQCNECEKGFTVRSTYEGHMNMHKGIKPYHCSFCVGQFQNLSNKLNHIKKIHPEKKHISELLNT